VPPHLLEIDGAGAVAERDEEVHGERHHADAREDGHEAPADEGEEGEHVDDERGADRLRRSEDLDGRHVLKERAVRPRVDEPRLVLLCIWRLHEHREIHLREGLARGGERRG
jgi:hypothetical protein